MILHNRIRKELMKRAKNDVRSIAMWEAYIRFLEKSPDLAKHERGTSVHHILWQSDYPQYKDEKWNLIRLSNRDHTTASALMLGAEPINNALYSGFNFAATITGAGAWNPTEKQRKRIVNLYTCRFKSTSHIAKIFNKTHNSVSRILLEENIVLRSSGNKTKWLEWKSKNLKKLISLYESGTSAEKIGLHFGILPGTVIKFLIQNGVKRRSKFCNSIWEPKNHELVLKAYKIKLLSIDALAKRFKTSFGKARAFLIRSGVDLRPRTEMYWKLSITKRSKIVKLYKAEHSLKDIGRLLEISVDAIRKFLKKEKLFKGKPLKKYTTQEKDRAIDLYKSGMSCYEVGRELGCHHVSVSNWLKERKIKTRSNGGLERK